MEFFAVHTELARTDLVLCVPTPEEMCLVENGSSNYFDTSSLANLVNKIPNFNNAISCFTTTPATKTFFETEYLMRSIIDLSQYQRGEKFIFKNGSYLIWNGSTLLGYTENNTYCMNIGVGAEAIRSMPSRPYYTDAIQNAYENAKFIQYQGVKVGVPTARWLWDIPVGSGRIFPYGFGGYASESGYNLFWDGLVPDIQDTDPYAPGGSSGGGGGTGDFDDTSDTIGLPSLPTLSGLNTGFFTAFIPSASQMQSVSNYLWNNLIADILDPDQTIGEKIDALKKVVANPYDAIMGCSIIPVTPPTAGSKELKMYGLIETGITLPYASSRWVSVDCGTLNIKEFWGGYLDYSPYTKTTSLYLPYIGTVSIDIDLIMSKALRVVYYIDILSGICVAFVLVDGSVKFHYQGQCATQIPITNADYSSTISAGIGLIGNVSQVVGSAVTGGVGGGVAGAVAGAVGGAISQAPSIASNVMGAKPDIRSGGSIGSSAGILSVQKPYLIIERPKQSLPERQNTFTGYPSNITSNVGSLSGYTEFESINLDGISLTANEKNELESLLKGGVYL